MSTELLNDAYAAAADWHGRLDEDDSPRTRAEFDAWLAADPRNRAAFDAVEQTWASLAAAPVDDRVLKLRREALSATHRLRYFRVAMAAAVLGVAVAIGYAVTPIFRDGPASPSRIMAREAIEGGAFRTAIGERSNITLSDGSSVVLNTSSRIEVRFTPERRSVRLLAGQAWFQVASNPNRPFVVEAADQRVTALGTAFDVRLNDRDSVQVTLAEGKVSVEPILSPLARLISPPPVPELLIAGEALIVSDHAPVEKRKADVSKVVSWRQGQVVFDNDTLATAIAEINRYSAWRIELADPALGQLRVSGVFKAGHSESFVETVTGHYPLQIASRDGSRILLTAAD
ncbi:FecR domain-containing protein [Steroidobacter sp. S1-65]|uniref:FecR domain-containing protein n=1 Tax=Steroidobacter gossypii TaxID=2805490 RepID=A0ABS1WS58_9GAMM|nr:FecR domain-containing protein [Steroidobacter gossypii]MBM0103787.1 FecR domain-containing protein [Steroidobacter gossypii]